MKVRFDGINFVQTLMIVMLSIGLLNHVLIIPLLLDKAGRDAWFSIVAIFIPYLLWGVLLFVIMKKTKQKHIFLWIKERYGSIVTWLLFIPFLIYLFFIGTITLKDTTTWTTTTYLLETPDFIVAGALMLLATLAALSGMPAIAISSTLILPFVSLFGFFVMTANIEHKDYSYLFPLFEHGLTPFLSGIIIAGGGFIELILIIFLQHHFSYQIRYWQLAIIIIVLMVLTFSPLTGSIIEFGPHVAAQQRYPAFEQWRLIKIGKYIEHVDFLSIYQWLSGAYIRITLSIYLFADIIGVKHEQPLKKRIIMIIFAIIMYGIIFLPISDIQLYYFLKHYYFHITLIIVVLLSLIIFVLTLFNKKAGRSNS